MEVESHDDPVSRALKYYLDRLSAPFAFQVLMEADFVEADCFAARRQPVVVPAKTLLSQLL